VASVAPAESDVATIEERDALDPVVELRVEDAQGICHRKETRAYDIQGNCTQYTSEVRYNSRKLPIQEIGALVTRRQLPTQYCNALGQRFLLKVITDPLGKRISVEYDAFGRSVGEWVDSPSGINLAHCRQCYDMAGNRIQREDGVIADGVTLRKLTTESTYDSCNRLTSLREAVGTGDERVTCRKYNACGQLESIHLPGETTLLHPYDALGRLTEYTARDNSIGYRYTYDAANNLLSVEDLVNANTTKRQYDGRGRLISETLGNGLTLHDLYDAPGSHDLSAAARPIGPYLGV
jgi:YD repeat-containing protein